MPMAAVPPRRFTLLDAMALVGAVAVGLGLSREWARCAAEIGSFSSRLIQPSWSTEAAGGIVRFWPVVAVVSPTLLILRARRPRPSRLRRFASPGVAACSAATIVIALEGLARSLVAILGPVYLGFRPMVPFDRLNFTMAALGAFSSMTVGFGVAAVWGTMALARRWRPDADWIDRTGRVVGWLWIALIPIRFYLNVLFPYLS